LGVWWQNGQSTATEIVGVGLLSAIAGNQKSFPASHSGTEIPSRAGVPLSKPLPEMGRHLEGMGKRERACTEFGNISAGAALIKMTIAGSTTEGAELLFALSGVRLNHSLNGLIQVATPTTYR
jgi:hypothetical protein